MEKSWKEACSASALTKINQIRRDLIEWVKRNAASSKELITTNQMALELALSEVTPNSERIEELKQTLENAYKEEELYWRQGSRIQWLQGGDRNSSFFHAVTRDRIARNKFSVIENDQGQAVYEEDQIVQTFTLFYQTLFQAGGQIPRLWYAKPYPKESHLK